MGDEFQGENEVLVHAFDKNAGAKVKARLYTFGGHRLADLRLHVKNKAGDYVPTRRGLTIRSSQLPLLTKAVEALREELEREAGEAS